MKNMIGSRLKLMIYRRNGLTCRYCRRLVRRRAGLGIVGYTPRDDDATIDHVIPRRDGGKTNMGNCVVACHRCNQAKGSTHPLDFRAAIKLLETAPDKDRIEE